MSCAFFSSEALKLDAVGYELVLCVVGSFDLDRKAGDKRRQAHLLLAHMESAFHFFYLRAVGEEDDYVAVRRLDGHCGATPSIDHSLNLSLSNGRSTKQQKCRH